MTKSEGSLKSEMPVSDFEPRNSFGFRHSDFGFLFNATGFVEETVGKRGASLVSGTCFGCKRANLSAKRKKTPGPKQRSMMDRPVVMPQKVPKGAQQSLRLGTATSSSRMLPRKSQRAVRLISAWGSSGLAKR